MSAFLRWIPHLAVSFVAAALFASAKSSHQDDETLLAIVDAEVDRRRLAI